MISSRLAIILLFLHFLSFSALSDEYTFLGDYISHSRSASGITVRASNNVLRLTVIDSGTVRIQVGDGESIRDLPSYCVQKESGNFAVWNLEENEVRLILSLPEGAVVIEKFPLRVTFRDTSGNELCADDPAFGHGWDGKEVHVWKRLDDDLKFFGLGEKTGSLNKRGSQWTMWNTDFPGYTNTTDPLYVSIPFFIGVRNAGAYGIFFDNSFRTVFNLGAASRRVFSFGAGDGEMNYYFFFGPAISSVIKRYTALTGRMPLPPKWSLGYHQCRWNYFPEYEVRDLAKNFRQRKIPADVLYLDIRYMDNYKVFTWDGEAFSDPQGLMSDLRKLGFRVVPIIDPGVKVEQGYRVHDEGKRDGHFLTYPDGELYQGQVWPGWCYFPDFSREATRSWWGNFYGEFVTMGISGFWNDMNEPAVWGREFPLLVSFDDEGRSATIKKMHNVYGHLEAQASYEGIRRTHPGVRPFIVTRAGYAGTQQYAAIWTGDNSATFEDLRLSIRMCLGLGLSGVPFTGPDVGGFINSPSPELFARWIQAGAFMPFFRTHSQINTPDQEPWSFGEETENNVRDYISLRYQLMPYIYSAFRDASRSGLPVIRPLFLMHQEDHGAYSWESESEYYFGDNILVAPVVHEGQRFRKLWLPKGKWLHVPSDSLYQGGQYIIVEAPWWQLPYFYRAGGFIPRRETTQYTDEHPLTHLTVEVIPGTEGSYALYLDAGDGFGYTKGEFDEIRFTQSGNEEALLIERVSTSNRWASGIQNLTYVIHCINSKPASVSIDGIQCLEKETPRSGSAGRGWFMYDTERNICTIHMPFGTGYSAVTIRN